MALYSPALLFFFPARFRLSSERCCCSKLKGLKVQSCALVQHVQGGLGREEMGVLHREPVRGLAPRTKTLFTGRPTTQQGGAAQRRWQATRAPCRTKYWHSERAETNPAVYWTLHIPSVNAKFFHYCWNFTILVECFCNTGGELFSDGIEMCLYCLKPFLSSLLIF